MVTSFILIYSDLVHIPFIMTYNDLFHTGVSVITRLLLPMCVLKNAKEHVKDFILNL
jgi:hypothetical protein